MKSTTTCKRTRAIKKKKLVFQPRPEGTSLGTQATCDFPLEDVNLSAIHARIGLHEDGQVYLQATGRTYFLIGACKSALCLYRSVPLFLCTRVVFGGLSDSLSSAVLV
jgi:hypothetical protein